MVDPIQQVVYVLFENRSFDHLLGGLSKSLPGLPDLSTGYFNNNRTEAGPRRRIVAALLLGLALALPGAGLRAAATPRPFDWSSVSLSVSPDASAVGGPLVVTLSGNDLSQAPVPDLGFAENKQEVLAGKGVIRSVPDIRVLSQSSDALVLELRTPNWTKIVANPDPRWTRHPMLLYVAGAGTKPGIVPPMRWMEIRGTATAEAWVPAALVLILALVTVVSRVLESKGNAGFVLRCFVCASLILAPLLYCYCHTLELNAEPRLLVSYGAGLILLVLLLADDFKRDYKIDFLVGDNGAYSISLAQVLFWTLIVFLSTGYVWLVTGQLMPMTDQILGLMGITAASHIASRSIGGGLTGLKPHLSDLFTTYCSDPSSPLYGQPMADLPKLQMFLWTILIGVRLCTAAIHDYCWTGLSDEYLLLIGISNGMYVGNKYVGTKTQSGTDSTGGATAPAPVQADADALPNLPQ
jgi:hypothetical protein